MSELISINQNETLKKFIVSKVKHLRPNSPASLDGTMPDSSKASLYDKSEFSGWISYFVTIIGDGIIVRAKGAKAGALSPYTDRHGAIMIILELR